MQNPDKHFFEVVAEVKYYSNVKDKFHVYKINCGSISGQGDNVFKNL